MIESGAAAAVVGTHSSTRDGVGRTCSAALPLARRSGSQPEHAGLLAIRGAPWLARNETAALCCSMVPASLTMGRKPPIT
jgi:hypothetical protein